MSRVTTFRNFTAGVLPIASTTEVRTVNGLAIELLVAFTRILVPIVSILQSSLANKRGSPGGQRFGVVPRERRSNHRQPGNRHLEPTRTATLLL